MSSAVAEMGDRGHNTHGRKTGAAVPFSWGSRSPSNTMWPGPRSTVVPTGVFINPDMNRKLGAVPLLEGAGGATATPSNTTSPGPRFTSVPTGILIHSTVWQQYTCAKNWMGWVFPFSCGSWFSVEHKVAWAEYYLHTKWHLSPSSRLATTNIGRNWGLCPFRGGEVPI